MTTIFNKILIVCVGNICRSPTAERILQEKLPGKQVSSAGLKALEDKGMDLQSAKLLSERGYISDNHRARTINRELVASADLILVMQRVHQSLLMEQYPEVSGKVMLLGRWSNNLEIIDPFLKSDEVYSLVYKQIETCCLDWHQKLAS